MWNGERKDGEQAPAGGKGQSAKGERASTDRSSSKRTVPRQNAVSRQRTRGSGYRVLLVESQPGNRTFVSLLLDKIGSKLKFQLVAVDNTIDAIEWLFTEPDAFDLVLFGLKLPDSSGVEFCRAVRTISKAQNIPLAALVADREATVAVMETLQTAGLNGCFNPFASTAEMRSLLRQWLEQSPSHKKAKRTISVPVDN